MKATISNQEDKISAKYPSDRPNELIEEQTKKIPNLLFLGLAGASILASAGFAYGKKREVATFIGLWAPTLLLLGLYNKIVKVEDELLQKRVLH